jgi:hypothetical protein
MNLKSAAISLFVLCAAPLATAQESAPPVQPATPQAWRATALSDLDALRDQLRDNTPVAFDTENPDTQHWFDEGYRRAHALAERAHDQASYYYALLSYANGFHDPHLQLSAQMHLAPASWPGFITTARGDDVVVFYRDDADQAAPPLGARVISCDGRSLDDFRTHNIYPFTLNPAFADDRRRSSARIFMDRHNPFGPAPRRCVFESDGKRSTIVLHWRTLPEGDASSFYWDHYNLATLGSATSFGITTPAEGVTWIGVPTFDNGAGDQLRALVDQIKANAAAVRAGRAIVIDLRGNGGGNSDWGVEIARAIWGDNVINALPGDDRPGAVDWRASAANRDYIASFTPDLVRQFGADSNAAHWAQNAQQGISAAITRGDVFWRDRDASDTRPIAQSGGYTRQRPAGGTPPIPALVYVLSNGTCVSACLDFSDIVLHIPGVQLIGADTEGDGLLMEVRAATLPSGLVSVTLPMKVYRGRGRGSLEAYHADVTYDGEWTDEGVRAWVMGLIAAQ